MDLGARKGINMDGVNKPAISVAQHKVLCFLAEAWGHLNPHPPGPLRSGLPDPAPADLIPPVTFFNPEDEERTSENSYVRGRNRDREIRGILRIDLTQVFHNGNWEIYSASRLILWLSVELGLQPAVDI